MLEALATACALGLVDLFRLEMLSEADFTESTDWKNNDQRPDLEKRMTTVNLESDTLVKWAAGRSFIFLQILTF